MLFFHPPFKASPRNKLCLQTNKAKTNKMASDDFEQQSRRHFLMQFGNNPNEIDQNNEELWDSDETDELLSEIGSPNINYWDFSQPRPNSYQNLPANSGRPCQNQSNANQELVQNISTTAKESISYDNEQQRFKKVSESELEIFLKQQENRNTSRKTKSDMKIFQTFLTTMHNETRKVEDIPPEKLDNYLSLFFVSATKSRESNGTIEYEPSSLKSIQVSIGRYLKDMNYGFNIQQDDEFHKSRRTLSAKFKELKSLGLGNKINASDPLTDEELNKFYDDNLMGTKNPRSLLNTVYINNNYHFGLRGVTEHYNLCWGDISLKVDTNGDEYLQYCRERQTKTRQGDNVNNIRKGGPIAMENKLDRSRCPVFAYKLFSQKRPESTKTDNFPFYIQAITFQDDNYESKLQWYKKQRLGTKSIQSIIKNMAKESLPGTDKKLTGHSARKGSIQKQKDNGIEDTEIVQRTGHKNINSILSYSRTNLEQQKKTSLMLSTTKPISTITKPVAERTETPILHDNVQRQISLPKTNTADINMHVPNAIFDNNNNASKENRIQHTQDVVQNSQSNTSIYNGNFNFQSLPAVHPALSGLFTNATFHGGSFSFSFNNYSCPPPMNSYGTKRKRANVIDSDSDE